MTLLSDYCNDSLKHLTVCWCVSLISVHWQRQNDVHIVYWHILLPWKTQCLFTYNLSGFVNHYLPVESQKLYLSKSGFVNVQNWKNSIKTLNITIMFPFYNLFKVPYNTCQGCARLANWLKEKKIVLNE
jgi:hypothetical protein